MVLRPCVFAQPDRFDDSFVHSASAHRKHRAKALPVNPNNSRLLSANIANRLGITFVVACTKLCTTLAATYAHASPTVTLSSASRNARLSATA